MGRRRVHAVVHGRVQGVFFRAEAERRARALQLAGWVRNTPEGTVEVVFEGPEAQVTTMLAWCERGPSRAAVERVEAAWEEPTGEQGFTVR